MLVICLDILFVVEVQSVGYIVGYIICRLIRDFWLYSWLSFCYLVVCLVIVDGYVYITTDGHIYMSNRVGYIVDIIYRG